MKPLPGTPSDQVPDVLAVGRCVVSRIYVSLSATDPEGRDREYLRWHTFDHRPEQYRLPALRGSLRLVSSPECRAARAVSEARYDAVDHVMNYFFADTSSMGGFLDLAVALREAERIPYLLPMVERGLFDLEGMAAAPRVKVGADVLLWWPFDAVYLLIEERAAPASDLMEIEGVAGAWWGGRFRTDPAGDDRPAEDLQITYCFLDDDPVTVARRLQPALDKRWSAGGGPRPLLAAPFHTVTGRDYDRHLPAGPS